MSDPQPVVVTTVSADRPEYLERTLTSWAGTRRQGWRFAFAVEPGRYVDRCASLLDDWCRDDPGAVVLRNSRRLGVLTNPHRALDWAFGDAGAPFAVLAEEDVLVSTDVLEFFTELRHRHEHDEQVLTVCASALGQPDGPADAYGVRETFCPLVWGTWADRWSGLFGPRWFTAAAGPAPGVQEGWDWGVNRLLVETGRHCLYPLASRSQHIGEHGQHMRPEDFRASQAASYVHKRALTSYVYAGADR